MELSGSGSQKGSLRSGRVFARFSCRLAGQRIGRAGGSVRGGAAEARLVEADPGREGAQGSRVVDGTLGATLSDLSRPHSQCRQSHRKANVLTNTEDTCKAKAHASTEE